MAGVLVGLKWSAVEARLADADSETRARVMDLMTAIEGGALSADAERRASGDNEG